MLLTRLPLGGRATPHDLHVLGTPPAFALSQDQTLQENPHFWGPSSLFSCQDDKGFLNPSIFQSFLLYIPSLPLSRDLVIPHNKMNYYRAFLGFVKSFSRDLGNPSSSVYLIYT